MNSILFLSRRYTQCIYIYIYTLTEKHKNNLDRWQEFISADELQEEVRKEWQRDLKIGSRREQRVTYLHYKLTVCCWLQYSWVGQVLVHFVPWGRRFICGILAVLISTSFLDSVHVPNSTLNTPFSLPMRTNKCLAKNTLLKGRCLSPVWLNPASASRRHTPFNLHTPLISFLTSHRPITGSRIRHTHRISHGNMHLQQAHVYKLGSKPHWNSVNLNII